MCVCVCIYKILSCTPFRLQFSDFFSKDLAHFLINIAASSLAILSQLNHASCTTVVLPASQTGLSHVPQLDGKTDATKVVGLYIPSVCPGERAVIGATSTLDFPSTDPSHVWLKYLRNSLRFSTRVLPSLESCPL